MAFVNIRTAFNTAVRHKVEGTDVNANVALLKEKAASLVGLNADQIDMVYCGRVMKDNLALCQYGVKSGATIMISKKNATVEKINEPFDAAALQKLSSAIRIRNLHNFQQALEKTLENPTTIDKIVDGNKSLANDPVAIALLQSADLLMLTLSDSTARLRVFEAHPSLGEAVGEMMKMVNKEMEKTSGSASTSRRQYNMDHMDSEEDDEEDMEVNSNQPSLRPSTHPLQATAALPGGLITSDFFRQAMMVATGAAAAPAPAAATPAPPPVVTEAQLQQLRDMGIMDEALARRALEVSNGDVQAALEYIFGDDM